MSLLSSAPVGGPPFTVTQAQALIPVLQHEMSLLRPCYQSLKAIWEEASADLDLEIDSPVVRERCLQDQRTTRALSQIESSLSLFERLGVECRKIEDGVFEFPCLVWDRFVLLCWQVGDEEVAYWHEIEADYTERRPLLELTQVALPEALGAMMN